MTYFPSKCGKIHLFVENETPVGDYHDFLMEKKGEAVEIMVRAHQQQIKEAEEARSLPPHESETTACSKE